MKQKMLARYKLPTPYDNYKCSSDMFILGVPCNSSPTESNGQTNFNDK